jgi:hypothetical protein
MPLYSLNAPKSIVKAVISNVVLGQGTTQEFLAVNTQNVVGGGYPERPISVFGET